jgi:catechol 2,3-dioxygenase-like lactoylglutathione lyase family enzyme
MSFSNPSCRIVVCLASLLSSCFALAQGSFTHVHIRVPDTAETAEWHRALLGGEVRRGGGPGPSIRYGNGFVGTMPNEGPAPPSDRGVIDHFGIAVSNVPATVERAKEMGAVVDTEPREGVTAPVIAFIVDPWGTRMELLEDPEYPGVNHVHMMATGADEMRDWFLGLFGGDYVEARGKGQFHTIRYDDMWIHISESPDGERRPSRGRAIDHIGFSVPSLDEFRTKLARMGMEPYLERPNPPGSDLLFFVGIGGIHFEISER